MTKSSHWLVAGAIACFASLSACGSKGGSGSNGTSGGSSGNHTLSASCLGPSFTSACTSCIQASCASEVGAFANDCNDYIQCYCPNGAYSASAQASQSCLSQVTTNPSCLSSAQGMNGCVEQSCAGECQSVSGGSGGSSGSGTGGSGSGGSSGGSAMTAACGIAFTTSTCAGCVDSQCCSVTQTCAADQACIGIITCIHGCNGNMTCEHSCITSAPSSAQSEISNAAQCWSMSCGNSGC